MKADKVAKQLGEEWWQAYWYYEAGKVVPGLRQIRKVCRAFRRRGMEGTTAYAMSLWLLGNLELENSNHSTAEEALLEALSLFRDAYGEDSIFVAHTLYALAGLYHRLFRMEEGEQHFRQAEGIYEALGEAGFLVRNQNGLAMLLHGTGHYREAEAMLADALAQARLLENSMWLGLTLNNLAVVRAQLGNYAAAEELVTEAVALVRTVSGPTHPEYARVLCNHASLSEAMGNLRQADELLAEAVEIIMRRLSGRHPAHIEAIRMQGRVAHGLGQFALAAMRLRYALALSEKVFGQHHPETIRSLAALGVFYTAVGHFGLAQTLLRDAVEGARRTMGAEHPEYANCLGYLAQMYSLALHNDKALPLYQEALELVREQSGAESADYALELGGLGGLYQSMGRYGEAENCFQEALAILRGQRGDHRAVAAQLHDLAHLYYFVGRYAKAERFHTEALAIARKVQGDRSYDVAISLANLALVLAATGRAPQALSLLEEAVQIENRMIGQVFAVGSEQDRMALVEQLQWKRDVFLSLVFRYLSDRPEAVRAAMELTLQRKAILAEAVGAQRDALLGGRYPELQEGLRRVYNVRSRLLQKQLQGPGDEGEQEHLSQIGQWEAELSGLEADLAGRVPEMDPGGSIDAVSAAAVAARLPADAVLVEFARFALYDFEAVAAESKQAPNPARYVAFVLPAGRPADLQLVDLGDAEAVDGAVAAFRRAISGEGLRGLGQAPRSTALQPDEALRRLVFDPLLPALAGFNRLLLVPGGELATVPFEALPDGAQGYLLDRWAISYLSAGRELMRPASGRPGQASPPLVLADPDFTLVATEVQSAGDSAGERFLLGYAGLSFERLPGTAVEGERVARMLGVQPLTGDLALESQVKNLRSPLILHLATHGFFLPKQAAAPGQPSVRGLRQSSGKAGSAPVTGMVNPLLRSGVALAGANTWLQGGEPPYEAEDGLLTAEDVRGLDLLDTELVVLSACETGLGEVRVGEGVFGLRRAFATAGARTIVMSLWKVPDLAATVLMERFYENLLSRRMGRGEALREAQQYTRSLTRDQLQCRWPDATLPETGETPFAHPSYWGAFICQGETGPLDANPRDLIGFPPEGG